MYKKVLYPVIVVESWVFDRDLTKGMHCNVASENLVLDRGMPYTHGKYLGNILINFKKFYRGKNIMFKFVYVIRMNCCTRGDPEVIGPFP